MNKSSFEIKTIGQCKNFKFHKQNRKVTSKQKIAEIKKAIMSYGLERMPALIVSETTQNIIDGQHRFVAIQELLHENKLRLTDTVCIQWINCKTSEDEYHEIIKHNGKMTPWKIRDYVNSHEQTNENYKRFRDFARECDLLHASRSKVTADRAALAVIFGTSIRSKELRDGEIIVTEEDVERGRKNYKEIEQLVSYLKRPKESRYGKTPSIAIEEFAKAWIQWRKMEASIPLNRIILELKYRSDKYSKMPMTSKQYFIDIFNQIKSDIFNLSNPLLDKEKKATARKTAAVAKKPTAKKAKATKKVGRPRKNASKKSSK